MSGLCLSSYQILNDIELGYFRIGGVIHLYWGWGKDSAYKNMWANPDQICIQMGFRNHPIFALVLESPAEIQRTSEQFFSKSPFQAGTLSGWEAGRDQIEKANFPY